MAMKKLLVMRHAKSSWDDPTLSDHDRPLNKRGFRDAPRMGRWLAEQNLRPDLVLSSTASRAVETVKLVVAEFTQPPRVEFDASLYLATQSQWRSTIPLYADQEETLLIVGHNPGLEHLINTLTGRHETIPTAAIVHLVLNCDSWEEINDDVDVNLIDVWKPKEI